MNRKWIAMLLLVTMSGASSAAVVIDIDEVGADVVATASGTVNTAGFDSLDSASPGPFVAGTGFDPDWTCGVGIGTGSTVDAYLEADLGNTSVCSTGARFPAFGGSTGNYVGVIAVADGPGVIYVQPGYVSGSPINAQSTWTNSSLASLGLVPGVYVFTWGSGDDEDTLTVRIGQSSEPVPQQPRPIPTMHAIGLGLLALALLTVVWVRTRF